MQGRQVYNRDGEPTGDWQYNGSVANKAIELLGRYVGMWSDDPEGTQRGSTNVVNVERVEVYPAPGGGGPPVLEGKAREVDALSPGFDAPPAAEEQALS